MCWQLGKRTVVDAKLISWLVLLTLAVTVGCYSRTQDVALSTSEAAHATASALAEIKPLAFETTTAHLRITKSAGEAEFHFRNASSLPVRILDIAKACSCTKASTDRLGYDPQEAGVLRAQIEMSRAAIGVNRYALKVEYAVGANAERVYREALTVIATYKPEAKIFPAQLELVTTGGQPTSVAFRFISLADPPVTITRVSGSPSGVQVDIKPGPHRSLIESAYDLEARLVNPKLPAGTSLRESLVIFTDSPEFSRIEVPVSIKVLSRIVALPPLVWLRPEPDARYWAGEVCLNDRAGEAIEVDELSCASADVRTDVILKTPQKWTLRVRVPTQHVRRLSFPIELKAKCNRPCQEVVTVKIVGSIP